MRGEIIAVGTELLLGQIVDTHSAYLSRECAELGINIYYHSAVGDNRERLKEILRLAGSRSDLVLITGGLGPTEDDLTKEALAELLNLPLVPHPPSIARMEALFARFGTSVPPGNYKQGLVFEGGTVFENRNGTAPGVAVTHGGTTYVLMPGPPGELIPMFEEEVKPFLISLLPGDERIVSRVYRFFGIGESHLEERIKDLIQNQGNPTVAPLAKEAEVTLRLTAKARDADEAERIMEPVRREIMKRVGGFCYGEGELSLEELVIRRLLDQKRTLGLAESCTGGLITRMLTTVPGSSGAVKGGVVSYTSDVKKGVLGVPTGVIERYGAVSMEAALAMAERARELFGSDLAVSVTGVAGPDPAEDKPVGLVYIGCAEEGYPTRAYRLRLGGNRQGIQLRAAKHALFILQERLKKGEAQT